MPQGKISEKNTIIKAVISKELKDKLFEIAENENTSSSKIIASLIQDYVDKHNNGEFQANVVPASFTQEYLRLLKYFKNITISNGFGNDAAIEDLLEALGQEDT